MANRDMKLSVVVSLKDRLSKSLGSIQSKLEKLGAASRKIGAAGAIISAISFMGPLNEAAAFQQKLLDIAGTAELTGSKSFGFVDEAKTRYEQMALEVGQTSNTIAAGAGRLIAAGLDVKSVHAALRDIGVAATAANAEFNDMAGVAQSLMINLKVPAESVKDSLGALVVAGKLGSFELKDMAKEFPKLTSQVSKFGITGREAVNFLGSGLQIAMKGAADTSVAANNFSNFLQKALAPLTIKHFEKMGVDIVAVMKDAAVKGINPLEAMMKVISKVTNVSQESLNGYLKKAKENGLEGADALAYVRNELEKIGAASKISELFNDQQVLDFVVPMMANIQEFKNIKAEVAKATSAMTEKDFETQMDGINRQKTMLSEIGTQFAREWGLAFGSWLKPINQGLIFLLKTFRSLDGATGGYLKKALVLGAGVVLLATGIGAIGLVLPAVTAGFAALFAVLGVIFSPIGLIIAALAGGAALIWKNWDKIGPKLKEFWHSFSNWAKSAWDNIKKFGDAAKPYFSSFWARIKQSGSRVWADITSQAQTMFDKIKQKTGGIKFDFGGFQPAILNVLEKTLNGLATAFEFLMDVWKGFAPHLDNIGKQLARVFGAIGGTVTNIVELGKGIGELAGNISKFLGIGNGGVAGFGELIGNILGFIVEMGDRVIADSVEVLQTITGACRWLIDNLNGKSPDWESFFPQRVVDTINSIGAAINSVKSGLSWITSKAINGAKDFTANLGANSMMVGSAANINALATAPARADMLVKPVPQTVEINNKSELKVSYAPGLSGPASVTTDNKVKASGSNVTSDGGRAVGRN